MKKWVVVGLFVVMFLVPFVVSSDPYWLSLLSKLYINAMLAVSMWPLFVIGRLTLAHAAFYGMGAYGVSLLMLKLQMNFWLALPLIVAMVALIAMLLGFPTLRIRGAYFAMSTFAFSEVARLTYLRFDNPFGGAQGLFGIPSATTIAFGSVSIPFNSFLNQYYMMFGALGLLTLVYYRLVHSHLGVIMQSIHDANHLTSALGVNVFRFEMATFVSTAAGASFAGALYAIWAHYLEPNLFGMMKSIDAQAYVIVGGSNYVLGPILGAAFMTLLPEYLNLARESAPIITGAALIMTMLFLRGGFVTLPAALLRWGRGIAGLFNRPQGDKTWKQAEAEPVKEV